MKKEYFAPAVVVYNNKENICAPVDTSIMDNTIGADFGDNNWGFGSDLIPED